MDNQIYIPTKDYKVLVRCFTYNQSKYIEDALNGFAMQQTNFSFACLVMDDCSTDGEQEVIHAWMKRECDMGNATFVDLELSTVVIVPHKLNFNCIFVFYFLKVNLYGKIGKKSLFVQPWREHCAYEAFCEGDDYWIHPDKLQMQVDFLDAHPECQYVFTARYVDNEIKHTRMEQRYKKRKYNTHDFLSGFNPGIQNVCYRVELTKDFARYCGINGDRLFPYCASLKGTVEYIDVITSVYRVTGVGVSTRILDRDRFVPASIDFYNFHKNLGLPDMRAYYKGESRYLVHNFIVCPKSQLFNLIIENYRKLKDINPKLSILNYIYMILYHTKSKILKTMGLGDIKIRMIKV